MSQQNPHNISMIADDDLSTYQYLLVKPSANAKVDISGAQGEICAGVLQNKPGVDGEEARVAIAGTSKVKIKPGIGITVSVGDEITSDGSGYGEPAAASDYVRAIAIEASTEAVSDADIFTLECLLVFYQKNA